MFEQNFAFSLVVLFSCSNFSLILLFFDFLARVLFLNCFFNPFIIHSGPSFFCSNQISISSSWIFVHMRHFDIDFLFFFFIFI